MKIVVVGAGYVGLSLSVLLSQRNEVSILDIDEEKVSSINLNNSPIEDDLIKEFFKSKKLSLTAFKLSEKHFLDANFCIIATSTDYNKMTGEFDTSSVEQVIQKITMTNPSAVIVIKSTIPLGFTDRMREKYNNNNIIFSPEFLRESKAIYDNLYPSRIIVGSESDKSELFAELLSECTNTKKNKTSILLMKSKEAEAVKLFSNTFLAMRVSFFNELDTFSEVHSLSSKKIIEGVCKDPRIGEYYNNPSFGYGGYCLPKDTKQLLKNFDNIPNKIITAVVDANQTRKKFIVESILKKNPKTVGVYRIVMKEGSDNFRESATIDITRSLIKNNVSVIVYEPLYQEKEFEKGTVIRDLDKFLELSDIIIANRYTNKLNKVKDKLYTRDIFGEN